MVDIRTRNLLQASFRGVPFFVRSESQTTAGRRVVLHEYPNTNDRFVEDLGKLPARFMVSAFIHGPNWLTESNSLESALSTPGIGRLVMPSLGAVDVYSLPYSKDASQTSVGEITFNLEFAVGRDISAPIRSELTVEDVFERGDICRQATLNRVATSWEIPADTASVQVAESDILTLINDTISDMSTFMSDAQKEIVEKTQSILNSNPGKFVRDSALLARTLYSISQDVSSIYQSLSLALKNGKGLEALLNLTGIGKGLDLSLGVISGASIANDLIRGDNLKIALWPENTSIRITRNKNRQTLVESSRVNSLVMAYEQAADKSYGTKEEIQQAREHLEQAHNELIRVDIENRDSFQNDPDVRKAVEDIRLASLEILERKEQEAYSVTELGNIFDISAYKLTYQLYAESFKSPEEITNKAIELRGLNPTQNSQSLGGTVQVFKV